MSWLTDLFAQTPTERRLGLNRTIGQGRTAFPAPKVNAPTVRKPSVAQPNLGMLFNPNYGKFGQGSGVLRPEANPQTNNMQTLRSIGLNPNPRPRASRSGNRAPVPETQIIPSVGTTPGGSLGGINNNLDYSGLGGDTFSSAPVDVPDEDTFAENDLTYKAQRAALLKALQDYEAQMGNKKNQYLKDYAAKTDELGMGSIADGKFVSGAPRNIFKTGLSDLENDFASRGLITSGLYGVADSDLRNDFMRRQADLDRANADYMSDLSTEFGNFKTEQELTRQRAYADAIARRAAQYGLA